MSIPVLATKLHIPPHPPSVVPRPHLINRLNDSLCAGCKLALISAPAGFGKTTLVSRWVAECGSQVAWLSLDEGDNDLARFLAYLVAALQTITPTIGEGLPGVLQSPQPPPAEAILTVLLNDITAVAKDFILVLDDYYVIDARPVDSALAFLLEHLPPQIHLVIATREDPHLPLARMRARGQLTELRADELRFTLSEAAGFLNQVMGLNLSLEDITVLEDRTEGWIAGLKLAALAVQGLSIQGHQDIPGFIVAFAGDHRYIVDYLVEEVLQQQPAPIRSFLLQTSILDRLTGPLCEAVTGQENGQARLEALERGNFFIVPLTDQRRWYRYHHLFAEVLAAHLMAEQPDQLATLHRRASEWYERNDSTADAIRHVLAAEDFERAADLIERAMPDMRRSRHEATLLDWLQALPDELVHRRPVLGVAYAHVLLASGELESVEERLRDAERWLDTAEMRGRPDAPAAAMIVVDDEEFHRLPGMIAIAHAGLALARGDVPETMTYARRALDLVPEEDHLGRGGAAGFLGLAYWTNGELEAANQSYADAMDRLQKAGHLSDAIGCAIALADIRIAQGRLREAMSTYERGLQLVMEQDAPVLRGAADMYVGMSELLRERNDLDAARQHLLESNELGEHMGLPQNRHRWRVAMSRIREAEGDLDAALELLYEAERLYAGDFFPNVRPVAALKARVWVAQGRLDQALYWARAQGLSAHDDLSYLREFEHITLARLLLARHKSDRADPSILEVMGLLERLLKAAEEGQRTGSVIEILVLKALAHQTQGDIPAALVPLERALMLAEPEGYVRIFADEGPAMAVLLEKAAKKGIASNHVRQLMRAFSKAEDSTPVKQDLIDPAALLEPLSERELEVLRLLRTDLNGPEIARELIVSLNTLRTHTKNIYNKLGVNNRRAAVRRAGELDLL